MCGIFGYFSDESIDQVKARKALFAQSHRGPDNLSFVSNDKYFIGHNRLSIIDLSDAGNQPFQSECGNYIISYNGEIYNYIELRNQLIKKGYKFKSKTDTEVLLYGFIEYGENFLKKLDGIFAFLIFDKIKNQIFLARDIFGVKPLYYYLDKSKLIVSSEIKPLKEYISLINDNYEISFLALGSVYEPDTILKGVKMLPEASFAFIKNFSINILKYYSINYNTQLTNDIEFRLNSQLQKSVNNQLISDAPIGVFLSGGLDSSVLTYYASINQKKINTISITFDEGLNEEKYQQIISKKYDTIHHSVKINERDFLDNYDNFIKHMDQPTVDGLNIYFISNITKSLGIKCALSGIGSDEIFYGYPSFQNAKYLYYLKNFNILGISNHLPDKYQKLDFLSLNYPGNIYSASRAIFSISEISQILGYSTKKIIQTLNNKLNSENIINNNLYDTIGNFELKNYMKNQLLRDSDVFGMANSVEIRVPFLSKELTEMVLAINYKNKFSKKYNKRLLVETLRNKIPNEILFRKKKGFELPYHFWISNNQDILKIPKEHLKVLNKKNSHWSKKWSLNILNTFKNI